MSKERLEEIKYRKGRFSYKCSSCGEKQTFITEKDLNWLIEHAERYDEVRQDADILHKQNKRYREALEFYSDKENYRKLIIEGDKMILGKMIIEKDNGDKAREALESETE